MDEKHHLVTVIVTAHNRTPDRGANSARNVSSPAVSRWETGALLPSKTTDNLMRVIAEVPEAVAFLMDREPGIEFKVRIALDDPAPAVRHVREVTNGHDFAMRRIAA